MNGNDFSAAGVPSLSARGEVHRNVGQTVSGGTARRLKYDDVRDSHLFPGVPVYVGLAILLHQIGPTLLIISKDPCFIVRERHRHGNGLLPCRRRTVVCKLLRIAVVLFVLPPDLLGQIGLDRRTGGDHTVLQTVVFSSVRIPPHEVGVRRAALIGPPHRVKMIYVPEPDLGIGVLTAPGVDVQGVMPQRQLQIIGSGGADRPYHPHPFHTLIHPHHAGNAALRQALIDDVRL
ncbi:Uncharacterised protein [uncultured Clostridium sp.]|nr:Uncharacterised protein [uncultured Clostridium sp.]